MHETHSKGLAASEGAGVVDAIMTVWRTLGDLIVSSNAMELNTAKSHRNLESDVGSVCAVCIDAPLRSR